MLQDTVPLKKKSSKQKFVAKNKSVRKHIETILVHEESTKFSRDVLKADRFYFVPDDQKKEAEPQKIPLSTLDVIDTQIGCALVDANGREICILIPRATVLLSKGKNNLKNDLHLMKFLTKEKGTARGKNREGKTVKEVSIGVKAARNKHGFITSSLKITKPLTWSRISKYARQTEYVSKEYIQQGLLVGLQEAHKVIGWSTLDTSRIFSALSVSCDYYSPAHVDEDFFFSVFQCVVDDEKSSYEIESPIIQHFCFPSFGKAIAIRNGDVLLFNPTVYHCLSKKESSFMDSNVFVNSFYLKSKIVGLNDNRIEFDNK